MKISYDKEVDALYIRLLDGDFQCRSVRLSDTIALNMGPSEELVGIEILDAKETLHIKSVPEIDVENIKARLAG